MTNTNYLEVLKKRRTIYALGKEVTLSDDEVIALVQQVVKESPTAFNNQTTRAVFLFGENHNKLWDLTLNRLKSEVPTEEAFKATSAKIAGFKAAYATILFYTDTAVVKQFEDQFTLYKDNFYDWSEQAQGSAQLGVWTSLAENGIGANLQHYNPLIDDLVKEAFDIPESWRLRAEMPFGSIEAAAGDKAYMDDADRFKVIR